MKDVKISVLISESFNVIYMAGPKAEVAIASKPKVSAQNCLAFNREIGSVGKCRGGAG